MLGYEWHHFYRGGAFGWWGIPGPLSFESQDWEVTDA